MKQLLPLVLLAVALVAADQPAPEKPKTDKELLQGTWALTVVEFNGKVLNEGDLFEKLKDTKFTFQDDKVKNSKQPKDDASFTLDPDKTPPTLDIKVRGEKNVETLEMIYELKGDTLKLCGAPEKHDRPKELTSKDDQLVLTLKREKKP